MAAAASQWPLKRLKDVTSKIGSGATPRGGKNSYRTNGISLIRSLNVYDFKFALEDLAFISKEQADELANVAVQKDDILLNITGASVARCCIAKPSFLPARVNQHVAIVRVRPDVADARFVLYCINSPLFKSRLLTLAQGGATREALTKKTIEEFEVLQPPLPVQRRIACILSAYDELIENSQRRIEILEAMARALYREWFVHFRFPGHENHTRVASQLGEIPKGWEVTSLRVVTTKIGSGATPRGGKESYKTEGIALIRSLNIYDYHFEFANLAFIDEQQAASLENVTVQENDILLNITGASVARCALAPSYLLPARVNQHVAIVRADPAKASPFYILDAINSDNRKAQLLALAQGGSTREALTKDTVSNFEVVLPPRALMQRYDDSARGIHTEREVLLRQVQNLRRTRDLLLPRLLSGQIDVEVV
jgi:type I restriction enzyme, S subunit